METKQNGAIALVNDALSRAADLGASDIHFEPLRDHLKIRYRVDGLLRNGMTLHKSMHPGAISRIKVMADLNIAEQRSPQDGSAHIKINKTDVDLRVSTIPTINGEKAVIRLLRKDMTKLSIEELGMSSEHLKNYNRMIRRSSGIMIVTGPTGCGKTTTLYATLNKINSSETNIITIEDPVEYELAGISQIQVNVRAGLTFASGLRAMLRQDPDIIMVGEIRDEETARIAVQAAMTGHLVFSTMHTNDSVGAISRLLDLRVEPSLINSSLTAVISQRLIRLTCRECRGRGCKDCGRTGYRGRTGIFEMLSLSSQIKEIISNKAFPNAIREAAERCGLKSLRLAGEDKIKSGITSKQEVFRVIHLD
jgi:general secretion pathway protein E